MRRLIDVYRRLSETSSTQKMTTRSKTMSVIVYQTVLSHTAGGSNLRSHRREDLKSMYFLISLDLE
jgi:hypothetical protein